MRMKAKIKKQLKKENAKWPLHLTPWPSSDWPTEYRPDKLKEVWRSRDYLVQIFNDGPYERISVCRTSINGNRWTDGIPWEDLQRLKKECGRGDLAAVEIYPPDKDLVNVANMRHLWVLPAVPNFCWQAGGQ